MPVREVQHQLQLQLLSCAGGGGVLLSGARLSPAVADTKAFLDAVIDGSQVSLSYVVSTVATADCLAKSAVTWRGVEIECNTSMNS